MGRGSGSVSGRAYVKIASKLPPSASCGRDKRWQNRHEPGTWASGRPKRGAGGGEHPGKPVTGHWCRRSREQHSPVSYGQGGGESHRGQELDSLGACRRKASGCVKSAHGIRLERSSGGAQPSPGGEHDPIEERAVDPARACSTLHEAVGETALLPDQPR